MAVLLTCRTAHAQISDHLKCYKVRDSQARASYRADLNGLIPDAGCTIRVPGTLFCTQSATLDVDPVPPGESGATQPAGRFLCYKVKCPKTVVPTVDWKDEFGTRTLTLKRPTVVCAPEYVTTTTPTTTSTTTTTGQCTVPHAPCGTCGSGICVYNCPTATLLCLENSFGPACDDDADCQGTGRPRCGGGIPECSTTAGGPTGCSVICP